MHKDGKRATGKGIFACITGAAVNLVLGFAKLYIGTASYSISIMTDGINNFSDTLACTAGAVSIKTTEKAPTKKHPFGFGRVEYLAALVISFIVMAVGFVFAYNCIERLFYHFPITFSWLRAGILGGSILVKIGLAFFFRFYNKKVASPVLKTEFLDSILDCGITGMTFMSYILSQYIGFPIDAVVGLLISAFVIISGIKLLKENVSVIIGSSIDGDTQEKLSALFGGVEEIESICDIKFHDYGFSKKEVALTAVIKEGFSFESAADAVLDIKKTAEESYNIYITVELRRA